MASEVRLGAPSPRAIGAERRHFHAASSGTWAARTGPRLHSLPIVCISVHGRGESRPHKPLRPLTTRFSCRRHVEAQNLHRRRKVLMPQCSRPFPESARPLSGNDLDVSCTLYAGWCAYACGARGGGHGRTAPTQRHRAGQRAAACAAVNAARGVCTSITGRRRIVPTPITRAYHG